MPDSFAVSLEVGEISKARQGWTGSAIEIFVFVPLVEDRGDVSLRFIVHTEGGCITAVDIARIASVSLVCNGLTLASPGTSCLFAVVDAHAFLESGVGFFRNTR